MFYFFKASIHCNSGIHFRKFSALDSSIAGSFEKGKTPEKVLNITENRIFIVPFDFLSISQTSKYLNIYISGVLHYKPKFSEFNFWAKQCLVFLI